MFDDITGINDGPNGGKLPLQRKILKRPLTHEEMDYNLRLINNIVDNYPILGSGVDGELTSADLGKVLMLKETPVSSGKWFWVPEDVTGGDGTSGVNGSSGTSGTSGSSGADGSSGLTPTAGTLFSYNYEINYPIGVPNVTPTRETISFNSQSGELYIPYIDLNGVDQSNRIWMLLNQDAFDLDIVSNTSANVYDHFEFNNIVYSSVNIGGFDYYVIELATIGGVAVSNPQLSAQGNANFAGTMPQGVINLAAKVGIDKWIDISNGTSGTDGTSGSSVLMVLQELQVLQV